MAGYQIMTPQHWQQVKQVFQSALERPPDRRVAFLDEACASDPSLRCEVESLISSHDQASDSIEAIAGGVAALMLTDDQGGSFIGRDVGPYKITSHIGKGGMGDVYLAQDLRLDRLVALKLLPREFAQNEDRLRRFQREARAVSALNHPNILTIHEVGQIDSLNFIVAEFIEGETLRTHMRRERLTVREALGIAIQIASALATAHKAGIVHRDVKPENIMLREDGIVKVLDFGLAKLTQQQSSATDTEAPTVTNLTTDPGTMMGTVNYMSPEQARGLDVDERTDIFSLSILIYEMIAGKRPFEGETTSDVIASLLTKEPAPIVSHDNEVPAELERIVGKCLEKDCDNRYRSAQELLEDLEHLRRDLDSGVAVALAQISEPRQKAFLTRGLLVLFILAATILAVTIYMFALRGTRAGTAPETKSLNGAVDSIAVLPLANVGTDPDTEYLSDGITESLIRSLSHIPSLKVIARASVLRYKGQDVDPQAVGRELGASAVLTGRIIQRGDGFSISVELMDARDNSHLWGEQYNRKLTDLLSVQQEMSREISERLRLRLTGEEQQQVTRSHAENAEAYQLYLKGRYFFDRDDEAGRQRAREYFQQAIEKDPSCALAYVGLADAAISAHVLNSNYAAQAHDAKVAVIKALEIDSSVGEAHISLANIIWRKEWNFAGAEQEFKRGIELNPGYASAHHEYSHYLMALGRVEESLAESERFLELDPLSPPGHVHMGWYYLMTRQYDQAIDWVRKALTMDPNFRNARVHLGEAYYYAGMFDESVEEYLKAGILSGARPEMIGSLREAYKRSRIRGFLQRWLNEEKRSEERFIPYFPRAHQVAKLYGRLGAKEQAMDWLEKASESRQLLPEHIRRDPEFDNLRSDPRFTDLLRRIGLPQ